MKLRSGITLALLLLLLTGCSSQQAKDQPEAFIEKGSIILSGQVPKVIGPRLALKAGGPKAPVLGYIPPTVGFMPAENETWLRINSDTKTLVVLRGENEIRRFTAQGKINIEPGNYALQHKQKRPLWYAPDHYFKKRGLKVPPSDGRALSVPFFGGAPADAYD